LKKLYNDDGIKAAVTFKLSPAIRGPAHTGKGYSCVDEATCDPEVYFLCGQANGGDVNFFACIDGSTLKTAEARTKTCAAAATPSLPWDKIQSCFSGAQGAALKKAAADHMDTRFPKPVGVPRVEVNGVMQTSRTEAALIKALCATGIKAGACHSVTQTIVV